MRIGPAQLESAILVVALAAAGWRAPAQASPAGQSVAQADSARIYRSPDGAYSVEAPAGWKIRQEEGSNEVTILNGNTSVSVAVSDTEPGDTVAKLLEVNKGMLKEQCPTAEIREEGKTTVAGAPGSYFTMYCVGPKLPTLVRISASISGGRFYIFNVTVPSAQLATAQPFIDSMARSFKGNS